MFFKTQKINSKNWIVLTAMAVLIGCSLKTASAQQIRINDVSSSEASATQRFTISVDSNADKQTNALKGEAISLVVSTNDGTALAGADYQSTQQTITIAEGVASTDFDIVLIDDALSEGNETYTVNLSLPSAVRQKGLITIVDGVGVGTIIDNDGAPAPAATPVPGVSVWGLGFLVFLTIIAAAGGFGYRRPF